VIQETGVNLFSGVVRFYSLAAVRSYLKELMDKYQKEYDRSSNVIGSMLRSEGRGMEVIMSKGWAKVGSIFVNLEEPERGGMEVVFQLVTEMKPRLSKTEEVLRTFEAVEALPIPTDATYLLYLRGGVPERLVIDTSEGKPEAYAYKGKYETV
jgi:hypothetical protein